MVGTKIDIPLFPFISGEFSDHGSFWTTTSTCRKCWHWHKRERFSIRQSESGFRISTTTSRCFATGTSLDAERSFSTSLQIPGTARKRKVWLRSEGASPLSRMPCHEHTTQLHSTMQSE